MLQEKEGFKCQCSGFNNKKFQIKITEIQNPETIDF